ncbi:uncharacterized protein G2W53_011434 [Senna tora]|uniref:Uncharacterized protein n=1 Tax=Senna tora TaxID=362788 RepID=A0A834X2P7_9FABA|nr:uncharacterized protein G2W53_011434 [Senna tora]
MKNHAADLGLMTAQLAAAGGFVARFDVYLTHLRSSFTSFLVIAL